MCAIECENACLGRGVLRVDIDLRKKKKWCEIPRSDYNREGRLNEGIGGIKKEVGVNVWECRKLYKKLLTNKHNIKWMCKLMPQNSDLLELNQSQSPQSLPANQQLPISHPPYR